MLRRLGDAGEGSLSYIAVALLVSAIAAAVTVVALPDSVRGDIRAAVCRVGGGERCERHSGGDDRSQPSATPTASPAVAGTPPPLARRRRPLPDDDSPEAQEYRAAQEALSRAEQDLANLEREWSNFDLLAEIGKLGLDFLAGDIINCVKKPNFSDCAWALIGVIPWGKIGKALKAIPKVIKLVDRFLDLKRRLEKARKARKDAASRLDRAREACERRLADNNSFTPGTPVLMADGTRKPIERVRVGDLVWAADPQTGRMEPRRVTDRIVGTGDKSLVDLTVAAGGSFGGPTARLTATANHPFWVADSQDWIDAGRLVFGDMLVTPDGRRAMVVGKRLRRQRQQVFNLTVDGLHTFYVAAGGDNLLVHNCTNLDLHEEPPRGQRPGPHQLGHTIKQHIDISDDDLIAHARDPRNTKGVAGRWKDKATAQAAIDAAMANPKLQPMIQRWLKEGPNGRQTLELPVQQYGNGSLGDIANKNGDINPAGNKFKIILHRAQNPKHKPGWYIYTAYPVP
ncbi:polymorphic toxin-type HINT domain-containing protein [Actinomadura keratinilytica]|uniref:polymorphic toxin-type HINT domain-containing protein n=1 Tax=Actinomadura keratinilytica TaxID=547461 RepID=UPI0036090A78